MTYQTYPHSLLLRQLYKQMEKELIAWCDEHWAKGKVLTRGIIFRQALRIFPMLCGGKKNPRVFRALKSWFYGGYKKRCRLSKRRISSSGQKCPKNWKEKKASINARVAQAQMPFQRPDGSFRQGVVDDNMANTDQVPVYVEDHSNGQWGRRENHERRTVSTAGKEKDRFTAQLTCFKSGRKVTNYGIHCDFINVCICHSLFPFVSSLFPIKGNPNAYIQRCASSGRKAMWEKEYNNP